jgi:magnesium transporter
MLLFPEDQAAGLMTLEVPAYEESQTVAAALSDLSDQTERAPDISHIFIVDRRNVLVGSMSLPEIMFAPPYAMLREVILTEPLAVKSNVDYGACARLMDDNDLRSLPVVDESGVLLGAISIDDLTRMAEKRAARDVFRLFGLGREDQALGPFWQSVRSRFPWLFVNLMTVLAAGFVISLFESTIDRAALLAVFIPVVVGQAGIAGTQTVTMVVRALALKEVSAEDGRHLLMKEGALALGQGTAISLLLVFVVWGWQQDFYLGLIVGSSMLVNLLVAGIGGVMVPLMMKTARIDPAASSAVVVTTMTEMIGIIAYLGLATWMISLIIIN